MVGGSAAADGLQLPLLGLLGEQDGLGVTLDGGSGAGKHYGFGGLQCRYTAGGEGEQLLSCRSIFPQKLTWKGDGENLGTQPSFGSGAV